MLVEGIARKTLGLKRHCVKKTSEEDGYLVAYLTPGGHCRPACSFCDTKGPGYETLKERRWKHIRLWGIPIVLVYASTGVNCVNCGAKVEATPWG